MDSMSLKPRRTATALFFLILIGLLGLFGCRRAEEPDPAELEVMPQIMVVCNEACASRGQCGQAADGRLLVLGHPDRPVVREHGMIFEHETAVFFVNTREETLQVVSTTEQFSHTFYLVTRPEDRRSGWVAGWCVQP
jgi:hypothetical protein